MPGHHVLKPDEKAWRVRLSRTAVPAEESWHHVWAPTSAEAVAEADRMNPDWMVKEDNGSPVVEPMVFRKEPA